MGGHGPCLIHTTTIFQKHYFFENGPKTKQKLKIQKKTFAFLIGLFNGILHVLIFRVVAEKQKDFDWGYTLRQKNIGTICPFPL